MTLREWLALRVAYLLPKRVVYWCGIRVIAIASHAVPHMAIGDITAMDALAQWELYIRGGTK